MEKSKCALRKLKKVDIRKNKQEQSRSLFNQFRTNPSRVYSRLSELDFQIGRLPLLRTCADSGILELPHRLRIGTTHLTPLVLKEGYHKGCPVSRLVYALLKYLGVETGSDRGVLDVEANQR